MTEITPHDTMISTYGMTRGHTCVECAHCVWPEEVNHFVCARYAQDHPATATRWTPGTWLACGAFRARGAEGQP